MTIKKIITLPDPFLRITAIPVKKIDREIKVLLNDMLETMYNANGIGLAAPQIKDNRRLIVVDCEFKKGINETNHEIQSNPIKMINPEIEFLSDLKETKEEGCLSIPGFNGKVNRSQEITVSYLNENNIKKTLNASGLLAVCIQHEIDHLNGKLFIDYLSKLKREYIVKKFYKEHNLKKRLN